MMEVKMKMGRRVESCDCLVLCGESDEDLRAMVGSFVGV